MKLFIRPTQLWFVALLTPGLSPAQSNYATPTTITTLAGLAGHVGTADGMGSTARFTDPFGIMVDAAGNVYVGDTYNYTVRKITPGGVVTTITGVPGGSGGTDTADGAPPRYNGPQGLAIDGSGNLFIADTGGDKIRELSSTGVVTTIAGSGVGGFADGTGTAAIFDLPSSLVLDAAGNLYVADTHNEVIRKIAPGGVVTTFAGIPGNFGSNDGAQGVARFDQPTGIAIDAAGNLYVADTANNLIRKITPAGVTTTIAGLAGFFGSGSRDGLGTNARFNSPTSIAVDGAGNLYVADTNNSAIRKITPGGLVTTLAGTIGSTGTSVEGTGSAAQFYWPRAVAVDGAGNLYIADTYNSTIRKGTTTGINDFNGDGKPDVVWQNGVTGDRYFWQMNGLAYSAGVDLGTLATTWRIAATADFNGDGKIDLLFENTSTGDRYIWLMNGTTYVSGFDLGVVPTALKIVAAADFNGDGKPDILWENTITGKRVIWLMNGTALLSTVNLGIVDPNYHIVAAADFDGDAKPDILFENVVTGDRYFWLMDGTAFASGVDLGTLSTNWHIAAAADFDGDGKTDLLLENTVTGDRYFWLMNGTAYGSAVAFGNVSTDWLIAN